VDRNPSKAVFARPDGPEFHTLVTSAAAPHPHAAACSQAAKRTGQV
jgi:hypothetical protein